MRMSKHGTMPRMYTAGFCKIAVKESYSSTQNTSTSKLLYRRSWKPMSECWRIFDDSAIPVTNQHSHKSRRTHVITTITSLCSAFYLHWQCGTAKLSVQVESLTLTCNICSPLLLSTGCAAIDWYHHSNKPATVGLLLWEQAGTDRQTDRQMDGHRTVTHTFLHILCGQCQQQ